MKTAVFMRHAHAAQGAADDHSRELTKGGRDAARSAALELRAQGFRPAAILCSTARRACDTAEIAAEVLGEGIALTRSKKLYLALPHVYLSAVCELPDDCDSVLLVAHNPGLEDLGRRLGHRRDLEPAGYFVVERAVSRWQEFDS